MAGLFHLSEAAALAIHTMVLLAGNTDKLITTRQIAGAFSASGNHLAKVMQQLVKNGLVASTRGPAGGFKINRSLDEIALMDIYQAIDGKPATSACLFKDPVCTGKKCVLGSLAGDIQRQITTYFRQTTLEDLKQNPLAVKEFSWPSTNARA